MFEIPEDDDNFWNDMPLDDISNCKPVHSTFAASSSIRPHTDVPVKRLRIGQDPVQDRTHGSVSEIDQQTSVPTVNNAASYSQRANPASYIPAQGPGNCLSTPIRYTPENNNNKLNTLSFNHTTVTTPRSSTYNITPGGPLSASGYMTPQPASGPVTPISGVRSRSKAQRKFPGPAGLLPKLDPSQSMDMMSASSGSNSSIPVQQKNHQDDVILSSQTSDDIFSDIPWKTLMNDLQEDGGKLMRKFSLAGIVAKAGKKKLAHGKVAMVFAVIEALDVRGSDASVTLRDISGRMQGTVHRDILKDYEAEFQPGTALVLRQVSVISLTIRNHYLNITPANIVTLYVNQNSQPQRVQCLSSQESLHSVLLSLEKKAQKEEEDFNRSLNSSISVSGASTPARQGNRNSTGTLFSAVQTSAFPGTNNNTPVRPGFNNNTPVRPGFNNNTPVRPGFNSNTPVRAGFNNNTQVRPGFNNNTPVRPGFNSNTPVRAGFNNTAPVRPGFTNLTPSRPNTGSLRTPVIDNSNRPGVTQAMSANMSRPSYGTPMPVRTASLQPYGLQQSAGLQASSERPPVRLQPTSIPASTPVGAGQWRFKPKVPTTSSAVLNPTNQGGNGQKESPNNTNSMASYSETNQGKTFVNQSSESSRLSSAVTGNQSGLRIPGASLESANKILNSSNVSATCSGGSSTVFSTTPAKRHSNQTTAGTMGTQQHKWTFKQKRSPEICSSTNDLIKKNGSVPCAPTDEFCEELWQDDLTDDILSQLSEAM